MHGLARRPTACYENKKINHQASSQYTNQRFSISAIAYTPFFLVLFLLLMVGYSLFSDKEDLTMKDYQQFLQSKIEIEYHEDGIHPKSMSDILMPHQVDSALWMLGRKRALLAASFGLGKTIVQCEVAKHVINAKGGKFLVVAPLGVRSQFMLEDGPLLGIEWQYVTSDTEVEAATSPYLITNYERVRDGGIDPRKHKITGVSLDEGAVLRSLGSKTSEVFKVLFKDIAYKFVATATPSPNNFKEIIYYAEWLGVMDAGQALNRWFKRDPAKAGNLTLYKQHEKKFWLWVSSWALFLHTPSDLGYSDEGYELPEMEVRWHRVSVDHSRAFDTADSMGQRRLLIDTTGSVIDAVREKRATIGIRLAKAKEIIEESPDDHFIIWHHLEDERRAIERAIPNATSVYGSQPLDLREQRIVDFSHGRFPILATKPEIAGSGCNFQRHCHRAIYLGIDPKFHDFIQSIHRLQRFQQNKPVIVDIIYAESEEPTMQNLQTKWAQHNELVARMRNIITTYGLSHRKMEAELRRTIGVEREVYSGQWFTSAHNDCTDEMKHIKTNSIGLIHTSIPFGNHYEYTTSIEDFGHNSSDAKFWEQMDFLIPELLRVTMPGRLAAIHVKDRILYGWQTNSGFMEVSPFSDDCVAAFRKHGWIFEGRRTIVTDVVRENNGTYRLSYSEMAKDASKMGSGLPEYLLLFRKPPTDTADQRADNPIVKSKDEYSLGRWQIDAYSLWKSSGNRLLSPDELALMIDLAQIHRIVKEEHLTSVYDYERHVEIVDTIDAAGRLPRVYMLIPPKVTNSEAHWVWDDVVYMRTLNTNQSQGRRENHICPLPLDIVERTIRLYSNPDDIVLDPFGGLHTVPYAAIKMGRRAYAAELNYDYWSAGIKYCDAAEMERSAPTLFDLVDFESLPELEMAAD